MNYLVTGNTGSGKSSVAEELSTKGFLTIDTDQNGYSNWLELATGKTHSSRPDKSSGWENRYEWLWNEPKIEKVLDENKRQTVFICGVASNQVTFYPKFSKIFLLEVSPDILRQRLTTRTNNPFGKRPGDIDNTLERNTELNNMIVGAGAIRIDASQPLAEVVNKILSHIT